MKPTRNFLVIVLALLIGHSFAQTNETVIRSEDLQEIDGRQFYIHTVKEGHTLYSISRAYEVTITEIITNNPGISSKLKPGEKIKVPYGDKASELLEIPTGQGYNMHRVKDRETLYGLASTYGVSMEGVIAANNGLPDGLKVGALIRIPSPRNNAEKEPGYKKQDNKEQGYIEYQARNRETLYYVALRYRISIDSIYALNPGIDDVLVTEQIIKLPSNGTDDNFITHMVKERQTVKQLARKYGLQIEDIQLVNPYLSRHLQVGYVVRIPLKEIIGDDDVIPDAELSHDDNDNKPWLKKDEQEQCIEMDESGNYKIALILPFYLSQLVDEPTKMVDETDDISSPGYIKPFTFIHFYEGFMLAVDSLKQAGLNVEIFVFDLGNDAFETKLLLRNPELQYMDLIIGPVFSTSFKIVAAFAKEHRIFIVNPFSTRDEIIYDNEYVFKVRPSVDDQLRVLVDYLNNNHKSSQIFLARHDSYSHSLDIERLKSIFNQDLNQRVGPYTDLYHEIVYSRDSTYTFVHQATVDNENVVIAYSDDRVFIFDFLRKFNELRDTFNITIIGIPDWKKLDGLELEYLNNLNAHLISESYTDYTLDNVISFVNKFRDAYQTEPQEYAFEGYDIGYYFLGALKKFGKNFGRCIKYHDKRLLRYGFDFEQNQGNGYVNHSCKILSMWNYRYLDITPVFSETEK